VINYKKKNISDCLKYLKKRATAKGHQHS